MLPLCQIKWNESHTGN